MVGGLANTRQQIGGAIALTSLASARTHALGTASALAALSRG
jgi:hypothetical protein